MSMKSLKQRKMSVDPRSRVYLEPIRIVWTTGTLERSEVNNVEGLLSANENQVTKEAPNACILTNKGQSPAILLDFGMELHGGIRLSVVEGNHFSSRSIRIRIRFGESAMEAMSEIGGTANATNDHTARDSIVDVGLLGSTEFGTTGFRFVRIDLLDEGSLELQSVQAIFVYRDIAYKGSFQCSDPLLNQIWETGAYTVHLNMQEYLWDGIKRDRMVWTGDMHPEVATISAVFGEHEIVPSSLDFKRDRSPLPMFMDMPTYSIWWLLVQYDWYMQHGNKAYLCEQQQYVTSLLRELITKVADDGTIDVYRPFLDWPASSNTEGVTAGVHALFVIAMQVGASLCRLFHEDETAALCESLETRLREHIPHHAYSKQGAALQVIAGLINPLVANEDVIAPDAPKGYSTFYGYYMLRARALAGDIEGSLHSIRAYWGGMLSLGATTFWEDFDLSWLENGARIDELTPPNKIDVHGSYGGYCYKGYRHSLCHGWASGPTAWLSEFVLGITPAEPGFRKVKIVANLGDLEWVEGIYPTPYGNIHVRHEKEEDGTIRTEYELPSGVELID
ncbi:alpha-L-rhamnosidase-related protein [Paenibacillus endoradicis]|uniref:alpha-L-rhamnosidase-related protein n=1 Tax=Paenibacillus endoradicis TaxID=2972487 RepID=UPI00215909B5|nr:alpha-L-rhamnosidase C-terminal domain-containing protein [Paenibacillus endoradicis]MCR8660594.1 alpha-L-rhamnosidase [Paenibacillus endoradicis]